VVGRISAIHGAFGPTTPQSRARRTFDCSPLKRRTRNRPLQQSGRADTVGVTQAAVPPIGRLVFSCPENPLSLVRHKPRRSHREQSTCTRRQPCRQPGLSRRHGSWHPIALVAGRSLTVATWHMVSSLPGIGTAHTQLTLRTVGACRPDEPARTLRNRTPGTGHRAPGTGHRPQ
jgi:hypothetical protein